MPAWPALFNSNYNPPFKILTVTGKKRIIEMIKTYGADT